MAALGFLLLMMLGVGVGRYENSTPPLTESLCGASEAPQGDLQVFATLGRTEVSTGRWKRYRSQSEIPESGNEESAITEIHGGKLLVNFDDGAQDYTRYSTYCFGENGKLLAMRLQVRTAWDWGYLEEGRFNEGKLHLSRSYFFSTETENHIPKPSSGNDVPGLRRPKIYRSVADLPFAKLLSFGSARER